VKNKITFRIFVTLCVLMPLCMAAVCPAQQKGTEKKTYRGMLGPNSNKIKTKGNKVYISASRFSAGPNTEWYDFTGSPIPAADLQFGIGKDSIPSIDDPLFVSPDDPRLLKIGASPYRRTERPKTNDDILVIGYVIDNEAKAYPIALLDHHELVNDNFGKKKVTVGW